MGLPPGTGANTLPIQSTKHQRRTIIRPTTTANSAPTNRPSESLPVTGNDTPEGTTIVEETRVVVGKGVISIDVIVNASYPPAGFRSKRIKVGA